MVTIYDRNNGTELLLSDARQEVSAVLLAMREELDDHRLAINENTTELMSGNDVLNQLNAKLDKLAERVDELTLLFKGSAPEKTFEIQPLSPKEKEVFYALYVETSSCPFASYEQVARKAMLTKEMIVTYIAQLIQKGVPLMKRHDGSKMFVKIDPAFRELQAKKNVIGLNAPLTCWI